MKKINLILFIFTVSLFANVKAFVSHKNVVHGSTFAVILQSDKKLSFAPNVIFKEKTYQMFSIKGKATAYEVFLPVDYHTKKMQHSVLVKYKQNNKVIKEKLSITVVSGTYKKNEIIKVSKSKVTLSKKSKERSKKEYNKVFKNVYSVINSKNNIINSKFQMPMRSKITSAYGTARVYNGIAKTYHTGTDFRAKIATKIYAANDGVIALKMKRFYLGNVVYIDHGRASYTYYAHMSKILVKDGQKIKKGEVIGLSGVTGRITGPHLHYANRLYNVTVDPLQYASLYNDMVKKYH